MAKFEAIFRTETERRPGDSLALETIRVGRPCAGCSMSLMRLVIPSFVLPSGARSVDQAIEGVPDSARNLDGPQNDHRRRTRGEGI